MLDNGKIHEVDDVVDIFADAYLRWNSWVNSKVEVPDSVIHTYHELRCTLVELSWVVYVERVSDSGALIDRCV